MLHYYDGSIKHPQKVDSVRGLTNFHLDLESGTFLADLRATVPTEFWEGGQLVDDLAQGIGSVRFSPQELAEILTRVGFRYGTYYQVWSRQPGDVHVPSTYLCKLSLSSAGWLYTGDDHDAEVMGVAPLIHLSTITAYKAFLTRLRKHGWSFVQSCPSARAPSG